MKLTINRNLIFAQHQQIETKRLRLRPVTLEDAADMYEYASDEENTFFVFPRHQTLSDTKNCIADWFMKEPLGKYGIEQKETRKLIGTIDLRVQEINRTAEIGYILNKRYWGNGYVPEAAGALLRLGFEKLELVRIHAWHNSDNPNSGRVMEKLHMKQEGFIPDAQIVKGELISMVLRGITKAEWLALQQA